MGQTSQMLQKLYWISRAICTDSPRAYLVPTLLFAFNVGRMRMRSTSVQLNPAFTFYIM